MPYDLDSEVETLGCKGWKNIFYKKAALCVELVVDTASTKVHRRLRRAGTSWLSCSGGEQGGDGLLAGD